MLRKQTLLLTLFAALVGPNQIGSSQSLSAREREDNVKGKSPAIQGAQTISVNAPLLTPAQIQVVGQNVGDPCSTGFGVLPSLLNTMPGTTWSRFKGNFGNGVLQLPMTPHVGADVAPPFSHFALLPNPPQWTGGNIAWNGPHDPVVGTNIPKIPIPFTANSPVVRLGNHLPNNAEAGCDGVDALATSFVVTSNMNSFTFEYAIVCQNPEYPVNDVNNHTQANKPRFIFQLIDTVTGQLVPGADAKFEHVASTSSWWNQIQIPGQPAAERLNWRRVSCHAVNLPVNLVGRKLIALFIMTDCGKRGHYGYAYLGNFCRPDLGVPAINVGKKEICEGDPISVTTTIASGVTSYTWSAVRLDANGTPIVNTSRTQTFSAGSALQVPSPFDIKGWYSGMGGQWPCGNKYRITLSVDTECTTGKSASVDIMVKCCEAEGDCCKDDPVRVVEPVVKAKPSVQYPGMYEIAPGITWSGVRRRVEVSVVNVYRYTTPNGVAHRSFAYVKAAAPSTSAPVMSPVAPNLIFPWVARWESMSAVPGSNTVHFPMTLHMSPPLPGQATYLRLTLLFRAYDADCQTCDVIQPFSFKWTGRDWEYLRPEDWPQKGAVTDTGSGGNMIAEPPSGLGSGQQRVGAGASGTTLRLPGFADRAWNPLNPLPEPGKPIWPTQGGPLPPVNCCSGKIVRLLDTSPKMISHTSNTGIYALTPSVMSNVLPASRVEVSIVNAAASGQNTATFPTWASLQGPTAITGFAPPQMVVAPFSHMIRYNAAAGGANLAAGVTFPMYIQLPKPSTAGPLYVHFTLRVTVMSMMCRPCDQYQSHYLKIAPGGRITAINPREWPIPTAGQTDGGASTKRGGGGR